MLPFDPLESRREAVQAEYSVLLEKLPELRYRLGYTTGVGEKFQLEKEIEATEAELEQLEQQLQGLERTSIDGRLYQALLKLGYLKQEYLFRKFVQSNPIAAFLIYGQPDFGQEWLLNRLVVQHTRDSIIGKVARVRLDRVARRNDVTALWRELGKQVGLGRREAEVPVIIERVSRWWHTQNVLLIFHDLDFLSEQFLQEFIQEFWTPLATQATRETPTVQRDGTGRPHRLLLFLVDYRGCVGDWSVSFAERLDPTWHPKTLVKLPVLSKFTETELASWLTYSSSELPLELVDLERLDDTVQEIFQDSEDGTPELTFEEICDRVGLNWCEAERRWMKL